MRVNSISMSKLYGFCVGELRITPEYFLDEMSQDEITAIVNYKYPKSLTEVKRLTPEELQKMALKAKHE